MSEMALVVVVDASVAVKWVNPRESAAAQAVCMRDDYKSGKLHLIAPAF